MKTNTHNDEGQPFLSGFHSAGTITLADFALLCLPPNTPDRYRLLWLMASTDWQPTPPEAVNQGFLNLRDTIRHLKDEGIQIVSVSASRQNPYSGSTTTERYRLVPDPQSLKVAYGLLIGAGFVLKREPPKKDGDPLALPVSFDPSEAA